MDTTGEPRRMDATEAARLEFGSDGPSRLVVGVDGSETSWHALYYAFGLARRQRSMVIAVYATARRPVFEGFPGCAADTGDEVAAELRAAVSALSAEHDVVAEFVCARRDPVPSLIEVATQRRADAIIIGASKAFGHKLFGSNAVRTVRRSKCPVTVVP